MCDLRHEPPIAGHAAAAAAALPPAEPPPPPHLAAAPARHSTAAGVGITAVEINPTQQSHLLLLGQAEPASQCLAAGTAEKLQLGFLRQLLGGRQSTPKAVVLAETGERPLWARWLLRATRLWNRALAAPEDILLRQAVMTSAALATAPGSRTPARQPWAQQLQQG